MSRSTISAAIAAAITASLALSGCKGERSVDVVKPTRGRIEESFEAPARTRIPSDFTVRTPIDGRVGSVEFKVGDPVKKGQVIATYDLLDLEQEVAELQSLIEQYQTQQRIGQNVALEDSLVTESAKIQEAMAFYVQSAEAAVSSAQSVLERRQAQLEETKRLVAKGAVSQESLQDLQLSVDTAQNDVADARSRVASLKALQSAVDIAPIMAGQQKARRLADAEPLQSQIAQVTARKTRAEHKLVLASIASPMDGTILEVLHAGSDAMAAGQELVRIGDLSKLEVAAEVLTEDAQRIRIGSEVELTLRRGGKSVTAAVASIEPEGFTTVSSLGIEQQRVRVIIEFPEGTTPAELGIDYSVGARFIVDRLEDVLLVPRFSVLQDADGTHYVLKVSGGMIQRQSIEIGLSDDRQAQVLSGLSTDDEILSQPDTSYVEGEKVLVAGQAG